MSYFLLVKLLNFTVGTALLYLWWRSDRLSSAGKRAASLALRGATVCLALAPAILAASWVYRATGTEYFAMFAAFILAGPVIALPGLAIAYLARRASASPCRG